MRVVGATLRHVADLPGPLTSQIAFGSGGRWWHWDGASATAWTDGKAEPEPLDADALLVARPRPPAGRPLAIGTTLLTAAGPRPLHEHVAYALQDDRAPWGYYDTGHAFSPDGALLVLTQQWQPSRCCRDGESEPPPPSHVAHFYDTATGETTEHPGMQLPIAVGRERLVLAGYEGALYNRAPLYPLVSPFGAHSSTLAVALGVDEAVIATASIGTGGGGLLRLHRARDGVLLQEWEGPAGAAALAFHPEHQLLAVAGTSQLEVWRVDETPPIRAAGVPLPAAPEAIVFHPDGHRMILTGQQGLLFELALHETPIGGEASTPLDVALVRDDPAIPPLRAGDDVLALTVDDEQVHAYGRNGGLYTFDRGDGHRIRSWQRRNDEHPGVAFAARAPIFAAAERHQLRETKPTRRVDVIDARSYATIATTWIPPGELAHLCLSPRGTALAWSIEDDPWVVLNEVGGAELLRLGANTRNVEAIAVSDDDRRLAVANRHVTDNVFVGTVGETTPVVLTTPRGVSRLVFARDGERLFVVDFDGRIHVVDPKRGTLLNTFDLKAGGAGELAETPDGRHLAVARQGVVVLDASTGAEVARFAFSAWLRSMAATPDGHGLAVGDAEGAVHLLAFPRTGGGG
jgi:WD40 repeat protein